MFSDKFFDYALGKSLRLHAETTHFPVYSYRFNYTSEEVPSLSELFSATNQRLGISHGDDDIFIFGFEALPEEKRTPRDENMMNFFLDVYVEFMQTG